MEPQNSNLPNQENTNQPITTPTEPPTNQPLQSPTTEQIGQTMQPTGPSPDTAIPLTPPPKKSNKKLIIIISVVFGILICAGIFFAVKSMGSYESTNPTKVPESTPEVKEPTVTPDKDSSEEGTDSNAGAQDTERKSDIKAIHSQLEAFYAQNGQYPTFNNMNDSSWITTNMKSLDTEALKDPLGSTSKLATTPTKNQYSYEVDPNCDNQGRPCTKYELTATLSTGELYTKTSLN